MSVTSVIDEKKVKNLLDEILKAIQTEADPRLLNQYRALIRKNVSFFRRSYLAAYLLMLQEQPQGRRRRSGGGDTLRSRPNARNSAINGAEPGGGAESARQGQKPAQPSPAPVALPEDESSRLFINIGRNRRVFPREILALIGSRTSVSKEDIGTITILNNYSFVQVRNSVAAELVDALNGVGFRGRTLTVNYARARKEGEEDLSEEPAARLPEQDAGYTGSDGSDAMDADAISGSGAYGDAAYEGGDSGDDPVDADAPNEADASNEAAAK
jgi:hypothetical protein